MTALDWSPAAWVADAIPFRSSRPRRDQRKAADGVQGRGGISDVDCGERMSATIAHISTWILSSKRWVTLIRPKKGHG